jgi:hypothetical protein
MSTHLPECDLSIDCGLPHCQGYCQECEMYCICDRLNACTARVRAACIAAVEATIQHDDACKSVIPGRECNCTRFDALAALREVQP